MINGSKNAIVCWVLEFSVCVLLKDAVIKNFFKIFSAQPKTLLKCLNPLPSSSWTSRFIEDETCIKQIYHVMMMGKYSCMQTYSILLYMLCLKVGW